MDCGFDVRKDADLMWNRRPRCRLQLLHGRFGISNAKTCQTALKSQKLDNMTADRHGCGTGEVQLFLIVNQKNHACKVAKFDRIFATFLIQKI